MSKLSLYKTENIDELLHPDHYSVTLDSSALEVFTDFNRYEPLVIDASTPAATAEKLLQKVHVRLKLVVDKRGDFVGVIGINDIGRQEYVKKIAAGFKHEELCVEDFMKPKKDLKAFDLTEIKTATIDDVIHALRENGEQHCLVVDHANHYIRGIISASDIVKKLDLPLSILEGFSFEKVSRAAQISHKMSSCHIYEVQ